MDKEENKDKKNKAVIDDPDSNADDHGKIQGGNKRKGTAIFDDPPKPKRVRNHPVQKIENADQERSANIDDQKDNNLQKSQGVTKTPAGKFRARIWDNAGKKKRGLGSYDIEEDAAKEYRTAKETMKREKMGNLSSSRASAGEAGSTVGFVFGSASASINAGGAPGAGREANTMEMVGVDEPSQFISVLLKNLNSSEPNKFNPEISEGELLYNCNMQERPHAELLVVEDMPREQRMAMPGSGIGRGPSNQVMINAAMKAKEEDQRQPFLTSKSSSSVGKESSSILRITEKLQALNVSDHHASEKLEVSTSTISVADPEINSILNFPENSQCGNDLEQLGLVENLPLCNEADNEQHQHLDHRVTERLGLLDLDTDYQQWLNEKPSNEQDNP